VLTHEWQTVPERGVVRSREPFKFWWAPTISLERLNLDDRQILHAGRLYQILAYGDKN